MIIRVFILFNKFLLFSFIMEKIYLIGSILSQINLDYKKKSKYNYQ